MRRDSDSLNLDSGFSILNLLHNKVLDFSRPQTQTGSFWISNEKYQNDARDGNLRICKYELDELITLNLVGRNLMD